MTDQYGAAFAGSVTWSSSAPQVFGVSADGVATAVANGSGTVTASLQGVSATASVTVEQIPAGMTALSGNDQEGRASRPLPEPLSVLVQDAGDVPVANVVVAFTAADASGDVTPSTLPTDASGRATTTWTLGSAYGTQSVVASIDQGASAVFTATALTPEESVDSIVVVAGGAQEGLAGHALAEAVVVRVNDADGSPVADVTVSFIVAEGHGSADPRSVVTDTAGMASTSWTLGEVSGVQSLIASAAADVSAEIRALAGEVPVLSDTAVYSITFNATWSAATHPTDFPPGPHFSPLIGAVHNDSVSFWASGETASPGIEQMAETGGTSSLTREIRARIPGNALSVINGRGIGSPASTTIDNVHVSRDYPLITLVTMIAPSPDWFVGVTGHSLQDEFGQWVDELTVVLYPYDSGTDDGVSYRSANADSSPKQLIRSLKGVSPFSDEPIGTYTLTRTDVSGSR